MDIKDRSDLVYLNLEQLKLSPLNSYEINDVDELVNSIKAVGLLTPLTVVLGDDGKYEILSGNRRFSAISQLAENGEFNGDSVPCYVIKEKDEGMDDLSKKLVIEISNLETRDFDKNKHRFAVVDIVSQMEQNSAPSAVLDKITEYLKVSPRYARMYKKVAESGTHEVKESAINGDISMKEAESISVLNEEEQNAALADLKEKKEEKKIKPKKKETKRNDGIGTDEEIGQALDEASGDDYSALMTTIGLAPANSVFDILPDMNTDIAGISREDVLNGGFPDKSEIVDEETYCAVEKYLDIFISKDVYTTRDMSIAELMRDAVIRAEDRGLL